MLVPGFASDAASADAGVAASGRDAFRTASDVLGTAVGETLGYLLTAIWTVLVIVALGRRFAGRWFPVLGGVSAALVLVGVLSPLDLPGVDTANFFGYVLWAAGVALLSAAWVLLRRRTAIAGHGIAVGTVAAIAALWMVPLLLAPPIGSRDVYSYVAHGELAVRVELRITHCVGHLHRA